MMRIERDTGDTDETAEQSKARGRDQHQDAGEADPEGTEHIEGGAFTANPDVYDDREQGSGEG